MGEVIRVPISTITAGVATALRARPEINQAMAGIDLKETIPENAVVQVYFESKSLGEGTDRMTMGRQGVKPIRKNIITINVDVYARQRSNIGQDMQALEDLVDVVDDILENQDATPAFGISGIKSFTSQANRVTFEYNKVDYVGVRYVLTFTLF